MSEEQTIKDMHDIQKALKAPKGQTNSFGNYKYRSCEDILEAVKKLLPEDHHLIISDEIVQIGDRIYVKATARLVNCEKEYAAVGWAREPAAKKGMDESQITGATSSYARKYALNGLFCIDDTKDADTDEHREEATNTPDREMTDKEAWAYKDICFLINEAQDQVTIESILDEYSAIIEAMPETNQAELNEFAEDATAKRKAGIQTQNNVYHFANVTHALAYLSSMKEKIPQATDPKKLEAFIKRWDGKLKALEKSLSAKQYQTEDGTPYMQVINIYNAKMTELLKEKKQ